MKNVILGIIIIGLLVFGGYYYYQYQELLQEQQQAHLYNQVVINGQVVDQIHFIEDNHGRFMLSVEILRETIDSSIYLSGSKSRIYIPMLGKNYRLENKQLTQYVRQHIETINLPVRLIEDRRYVEFGVLEKLYGLSINRYETYNTLVIENRLIPKDETVSGKVKLFAKTDEGMKSLGKFQTTSLIFLKEVSEYSLVLMDTGILGYVKTDAYAPRTSADFRINQPLNTPRINNTLPEDFVLTWHQVGSFAKTADIGPQETLPIDVISPTWFALNVEGIVINEASLDYSQKAHEKGYKVWGLYSNSFKPQWTKDLFESPDFTGQSIAQLLVYSALYDLDGLNFDFENIYIENKKDYVAYVAETVGQLQFQNLRTSLDITVPWGSDQWSKVYDRVELSKYVDYMCLMAYDEYWAASKKAGPVASMAWVEKGITESLKLIPKEKLVLSIPMYMRTWAIQSNGNAKSKSMSWKTASAIKESFGKDIKYDEKSGQNFLTYKEGDTRYKLWLEDAMSLEKRMNMAKQYGLPGIAIWSKGFANDEAWTIIRNVR